MKINQKNKPQKKIANKLIGKIISVKMKNTAKILVKKIKRSRLYGKKYIRSRKYYADNPAGRYKVGDMVILVDSKPKSKIKRWKITEKLKVKNDSDGNKIKNS